MKLYFQMNANDRIRNVRNGKKCMYDSTTVCSTAWFQFPRNVPPGVKRVNLNFMESDMLKPKDKLQQ